MRRLMGAVGMLSVLFLLGVGGDRFAAGYVADQIEQQLVAEGVRSPDVTIRGFPFVTQFLDGTYRNVEVRATSLDLPAGRIERISGTLLDVQLDNRTRPTEARARTVTAQATVRYGEVERASNIPRLRISNGRGGEVRLSSEVELLGRTFSVAAQGRIHARGDHLRIVATGFEVEGLGDVDTAVSDLLAEHFALDYRVPGLPRGVSLTSITADADGFVVKVSGRNMLLRAP